MTREELRRRKKELQLTNQEIADLSGVPLSTVQKVLAGISRSPRYDTVAALEKVLGEEGFPDAVRENGFVYGSSEQKARTNDTDNGHRDGSYTYSDYIALPDDRRVELIDGRFYDMASPNSKHQIIVGQLYLQLNECVLKHPGCMVLLSPMDVMLDQDDRTVVQPDLMVFCDLRRLRKGRVFGAPDLVVEVVSPGSERMDYIRKVTKYLEAGVKEYWIVDERKGKVIVYINREDGAPDITLHGMDEDIPVFISGGDCQIRMEPIRQLLDSLGDI